MSDEISNPFLDRLQKLSPKRLALLAAELERRLAAREETAPESIAVIGMACRMPGGAETVDEFWEILANAQDVIETVPADRWDADAFYDPNPDTPGKAATKWGGFIRHVDRFDAEFFGISPREALGMDPQQRMLLEVVWEALENACEPPGSLEESATGIYVGISTNDYASLVSVREDSAFDAYSGSGLARSTAAGRLSYFLGLKGPNMAVDTSCSSSAVAIHLACQALRNGECRRALAGGVNAILVPDITIILSQAHMLASDGRSKTFSRLADGFVRSEGCGMLVLKRLSDAQADGDRILGLIRGSAINHDGRSSGLTAPSGPSQEAVVKAALARARLTPGEIDYVETHGTGTVLGDAIELGALGNVFGKDHAAERRLLIGSVKTNVGHLEAAAGVTGVIKVLLALHHGRIPAHLHLRPGEENEALQSQPFEVPRSAVEWERTVRPRIAGVSSFGFSGTNAHLIIEEAPLAEPPVDRPPAETEVVTVSAKTKAALAALCGRYAQFLREHPNILLGDFAYTANACRSHFRHRVACLARTVEEAAAQLEQLSGDDLERSPAYRFVATYQAPPVAFLFTGQGSQYQGMGRALYQQNSTFRAAIDRCDQALAGKLDYTLSAVLTGAPEVPRELIDDTVWTQPALFAFEYALVMMWESWGLRPAVVLGHSLGEYVAACVAGVLSLEEALMLAYERGRLMGGLPRNGSMLAVRGSEAAVLQVVGALPPAVSIAAINGPESIVLSGCAEEIGGLSGKLSEKGIKTQPLTVSHAFHSPLMDPMLDEFERQAAKLKYAAPEIPFVSNATGRILTPAETIDALYWRRHVRGTVRFWDGLVALLDRKPAALLEIGPNPVLLGMAKSAYPDLALPSLPALRRGRDEWQCAFEALQQLYLVGTPVDWGAVYRERPKRKLVLPTYPFQRQRYWVAPKPVAPKTGKPATQIPQAPLQAEEQFDPLLYEVQWSWTGDHCGDWKKDERTLPTMQLPVAGKLHSTLLIGDGPRLSRVERALVAAGLTVQVSRSAQAEEDLGAIRQRIRMQLRLAREPESILLLIADASTTKDVPMAALDNATAVLALLQEVIHAGSQGAGLWQPKIWLITHGACAFDTIAHFDLPASVAGGIAKVVRLEHPGLGIRHVDLPLQPAAEDLEQLARLVGQGTDEHSLALRRGRIAVPRLLPLNSTARRGSPLEIHPQAAYLVTGAFSGLGLWTAHWLVERGATEIYLVGRREPSPPAREQIEKLQAMGARTHTHIVDVSKRADVQQLFGIIAESPVGLRGIVHSAGTIDDGILMHQTRERFATVFAPKVEGGWLLHELSLRFPLDFFVTFGSAASVLGSGGQANYAAANAFLDALAEMRRQQGLPATTIAWGPWLEIGLAARTKMQERWNSVGLSAISPEKGMELLQQAVESGAPGVAALPIDWPQVLATQTSFLGWPLFEKLSVRMTEQANKTDTLTLSEMVENTPGERRLQVIKDYVRSRILSILMLEPGFALREDQPLAELGLDSLMALELKNQLQSAAGATLPSTFFFQYPTLRLAATYLDARMAGHRGGELAEADSSGYEEIVL